jgi:hypothetical protein
MPKTKTIVIDEVLPADSKSTPSGRKGTRRDKKQHEKQHDHHNGQNPDFAQDPPLTGMGWKTKLTLWLTQTFLILRSKSYGKWIIVPVVVLIIFLAVPLAILAILAFFLKALFQPLFPPPKR